MRRGRCGMPRGSALSRMTPVIDWDRMRTHVQGVIETIAPVDSEARFRALGATVLRGEARFTDPATISVDGRAITARRFVIAAGSRTAVPPIEGLDRVAYWTNDSLFDLTERPDHLADPGWRPDRAGNGRRLLRPGMPGHGRGGRPHRRQGRSGTGGRPASGTGGARRDLPGEDQSDRSGTGPGLVAGRRHTGRGFASARRHRTDAQSGGA